MKQLITTSDGSHTIYVPGLDEHYHSIHGAVQESEWIFIKNGFDLSTANPLRILEVGFGTGLNALLTAARALSLQKEVFYTTLEKYPLDPEISAMLNHHKFAGIDGRKISEKINSADWGSMINIHPFFNLHKINCDLTVCEITGMYDLVYFDAFGPDKQAEMWTADILEKISRVTGKGGIFVTYSAKGQVRRNLTACGFNVTLVAGPPGKRHIIMAIKI